MSEGPFDPEVPYKPEWSCSPRSLAVHPDGSQVRRAFTLRPMLRFCYNFPPVHQTRGFPVMAVFFLCHFCLFSAPRRAVSVCVPTPTSCLADDGRWVRVDW